MWLASGATTLLASARSCGLLPRSLYHQKGWGASGNRCGILGSQVRYLGRFLEIFYPLDSGFFVIYEVWGAANCESLMGQALVYLGLVGGMGVDLLGVAIQGTYKHDNWLFGLGVHPRHTPRR